jgi:penicillin-binding protein 1C
MSIRLRIAAYVVILVTSMIFGLDRAFPPDFSRYADVSKSVIASDGSVLRIFLSSDSKWRLPTTVDDIDPKYFNYLVGYEDKRFQEHLGVDPAAVVRATMQWALSGEIVSGASTLTMQVARLLEPRPRTLISKAIEMVRAVQLETRLSKTEILSIYSTLAPFGGNLEGVRAASLAYFGKAPKKLTDGEAALLVALPQSPTRNRPDRSVVRATSARDKVLDRLALTGTIDQKTVLEVKEYDVQNRRYAFPFKAPHLARRLNSEVQNVAVIETYIVKEYQASVSKIVEAAVLRMPDGVNAAAIVVENLTGNVLAYIASAGFFEERRHGQVDFIQGVRSPGSALKPFIYAKAFEDGIAHPESMIIDRATHFGGYRPANFDGDSAGQVTAREALQLSQNVPAVLLLDRIGPRRFLSHLRSAGINMSVPYAGSDPGLAIGLGGLGITLEQLVTMYCGLARGGGLIDLSYDTSRPTGTEQLFFGVDPARMITNILSGTPRPRGRYETGDSRTISFKTGTSSGSRDVLAVGYDQEFTVGVWMGNPDAKPMPGATGMNFAAPMMFRIFDSLPVNKFGKHSGSAEMEAYSEAPQNLQTLSRQTDIGEFSITFPADGSELSIQVADEGSYTMLPIKLRDGIRPYHVFVNGEIVGSEGLTRTQMWQPDSEGFYSVVAVDREGSVAKSSFRLSAN